MAEAFGNAIAQGEKIPQQLPVPLTTAFKSKLSTGW